MSINPESPEPTPPHSGDAAGTPAAPAEGYPAPQAAAYPAAPAEGFPAPPAEGPPPAAPAPQQGTNGLAIAGLILAFLFAPIGFILSLIALIQTKKRHQPGKGLAIGGLVVSVLGMVAWVIVIVVTVVAVGNTVGKNAATVIDPGCTSGKDVIMNTASMASDPTSVKTELQKAVDGLNAAAAKAKHDDVRNAMKALADDYGQLLKAVNTGNEPPAGLEQKLQADANKIDELCTIGGATK